jgi:hypothetical protein
MTDRQSVGLTPVQWIAARAALPEELAPLVASAPEPGALVDALLAAGRSVEAVRCVAGAVPPREGIWWAWVSARQTAQALHGGGVPPLLKLCLDAVERWITAPTDERRRAAWSAGEALGLSTPAGATASAVFLSGGSVAAPGGPESPPPPGLAGTMVSTAILLAVTTAPPSSIPERWTVTVQQGRAIIDQLGGWDSAIAATWQSLDAQQQLFSQSTTPPQTAEAASAGTAP